jgi:hypothetical protein
MIDPGSTLTPGPARAETPETETPEARSAREQMAIKEQAVTKQNEEAAPALGMRFFANLFKSNEQEEGK